MQNNDFLQFAMKPGFVTTNLNQNSSLEWKRPQKIKIHDVKTLSRPDFFWAILRITYSEYCSNILQHKVMKSDKERTPGCSFHTAQKTRDINLCWVVLPLPPYSPGFASSSVQLTQRAFTRHQVQGHPSVHRRLRQ
ncbi:hypothetical protein Trydic_g14865 [Trypoxylus dichotomus]